MHGNPTATTRSQTDSPAGADELTWTTLALVTLLCLALLLATWALEVAPWPALGP